jgi:hypothetical protein
MKHRAAALALLVIAGSLVVRWSQRKEAAHLPPHADQPAADAPEPATPNRLESISAERRDGSTSADTLLVVPDLPPILLQAGTLPWERQIAAITDRTDVPDRLKARLLLQMLPGLPEEAIGTAAEQAVQRATDADYPSIVLPTVLDAHTHGTAMSVLFADLMERPDAVALPALLTIARNPAHSYAPFAKDNLSLLIGRDAAQWEAEIQRRVKTR